MTHPPVRRNALYCQAGGVTAVINASAAAVIETCRAHPDRIGTLFAGRNGVIGVLDEDLIDTTPRIRRDAPRAAQHPRRRIRLRRYRLPELEDDRRPWERLRDVFAAHDIGYVFYNGGNGSADTARSFAKFPEIFGYPLTCVHVPKTVDNDMPVTDCAPGFGSAAKYLAVSFREAAADVASMAASSTRVFILEAMGRHAGWMVAAMGLAATSPDAMSRMSCCSRRSRSTRRKFLAHVKATVAAHEYCVIGVSEGLARPDGTPVSALPGPHPPGEEQLGGVAPVLAQLVRKHLGYKCHWATADYLQRSARHIASSTDLAQAEALGKAAVELALAGRTSVMPIVVRESSHPYRWRVGVTDLDNVATIERTLPREFIAADRYHITEAVDPGPARRQRPDAGNRAGRPAGRAGLPQPPVHDDRIVGVVLFVDHRVVPARRVHRRSASRSARSCRALPATSA
jgi:6-phosphofructokinase